MRRGAHVEGDGVRFAVLSSVADGVDVCVFDEGGRETRRPLEPADGDVWQGHVPGAGHGTRDGFRVHGPWDPTVGLRCNAAKLLLDPYARLVRVPLTGGQQQVSFVAHRTDRSNDGRGSHRPEPHLGPRDGRVLRCR